MIEMLVVIGIIAVLIGASVAAYGPITRQAQRARGQELVSNVKDALEFILQKEDEWPLAIRKAASGSDGQVTAEVCSSLAKYGGMAFEYRKRENADGSVVYEMQGVNRYGLLSPWAEAYVRQRLASGGSVGDSQTIPSGGTVGDHRLRFAIDDDGDGRVNAAMSATGRRKNVTVRAGACVWCCGYDGKFGTKDDIFSWGKGQEE